MEEVSSHHLPRCLIVVATYPALLLPMNYWAVAPGAGIDGQLMENQLPSFWSDSLSRVFEDNPVGIGPGGVPEARITSTGKKGHEGGSAPQRKKNPSGGQA